MRSTQTLVHTPRTAGREDLVERPPTRQRIARQPRPRPAGEDAPAAALVARPGEPAAAELVLGRYRLRERLGAGGFGVVWRAYDESLEREVALKRIWLPDGDSERATREAQAAARLSHPAIVALYEASAAQDAFYLISELVRGDTLARLIRERALSDTRVLQIGVALSEALAHAHARGVIHRDVKPQNVLVPHEREHGSPGRRGSPAVAKLTDFGGARLAGDDVLTRTGDVLGTLAYMAPEQSEGHEAGPSADLYSLALVLYEAFSGVNPVRGRT
ncbi:MAG TPA: serine/threonine-protein kinase, partial [Solirubrobacteraceae bacterium]|nr:serine/threonine-protein kinase [Solirubrobacteraceae bacterium]